MDDIWFGGGVRKGRALLYVAMFVSVHTAAMFVSVHPSAMFAHVHPSAIFIRVQ